MPRIHLGTAIVCSVVFALLVFLNYVGERDDRLAVLEGEQICYHGWPFTYLIREPVQAALSKNGGFFSVLDGTPGDSIETSSSASRHVDFCDDEILVNANGFVCGTGLLSYPPMELSIWTPARGVTYFSWLKLLHNAIVATAIVAASHYCCRRRMRTHGSLLRVSVKEMLLATSVIAMGCAWLACEYRQGVQQAKVVARLNEEICSIEWVPTLPDLILEFVGQERLAAFQSAVYARLGVPYFDWRIADEFDRAERHALVGQVAGQVDLLGELPELERLFLWAPPSDESFLRQITRLKGLQCIEVESSFPDFMGFFATLGASFEERLAGQVEELNDPVARKEFAEMVLILESLREALPDVKVVAN